MKKLCSAAVIIALLLLVLPLSGCTVKATELAFDKTYYSVFVGETITPGVNIAPAEASYDLKSEFPGIAEVVDGAVKGVSVGRTVLTATAGALVARVTVDVFAKNGGAANPGDGSIQILYVIDEEESNYYISSVQPDGYAADIALGREGYDLKGWYADAKLKTPFDFSAPITESVKIYGKFDPIQGDQTPLEYKTIGNYAVSVTGLKYPKIPYTEIEIPQTTVIKGVTYNVTAIDAGAFYAASGTKLKCKDTLTSVILNGVTTLGANVFNGCKKLESVTANNLQKVGENAFYGTKWLEDAKETSYTVNGATYYHGAQLGNCYIYAKGVSAIYFFEDDALHLQVLYFAEGAIAKNTLIYVPSALYDFYYAMESLRELKGNLRGYVFENGTFAVKKT